QVLVEQTPAGHRAVVAAEVGLHEADLDRQAGARVLARWQIEDLMVEGGLHVSRPSIRQPLVDDELVLHPRGSWLSSLPRVADGRALSPSLVAAGVVLAGRCCPSVLGVGICEPNHHAVLPATPLLSTAA